MLFLPTTMGNSVKSVVSIVWAITRGSRLAPGPARAYSLSSTSNVGPRCWGVDRLSRPRVASAGSSRSPAPWWGSSMIAFWTDRMKGRLRFDEGGRRAPYIVLSAFLFSHPEAFSPPSSRSSNACGFLFKDSYEGRHPVLRTRVMMFSYARS